MGKLAPKMKSMILKGKISNRKLNNRFNNKKINNPSHRTIKPHSCKPKLFTTAKLHESLHESIVESNESEDNSIVAEDSEDNDDSNLLVNYSIANKVNHGHTMKLLFVPSERKYTPS